MMGCGHNYHNMCYIRDVYLGDGECVECGYKPYQLNQEEESSVQMSHSPLESDFPSKMSLDISSIGRPRGVFKAPEIDVIPPREELPRPEGMQLTHLQRFEELMRELDVE